MPRRTLLSSEQRMRLFDIPTEGAGMAKHYVLSAEDLALVRTKRRPSNRLGFAVQLCALRHPGRPLDPSEIPPTAMLTFVANQVCADPKLFGDYADIPDRDLAPIARALGGDLGGFDLIGFGYDGIVQAWRRLPCASDGSAGPTFA